MKAVFLYILLLVSGSVISAQGPEKIISCHCTDITFKEFCEEVYHQSGVEIYYKDDWVRSLRVSLDEDNITVLSAVKKVIEGSGLELSPWNGNIVLLPGKKLITGLPLYEQTGVPDSAGVQEEHVSAAEEQYITGRKAGAMETITIGQAGRNNGNGRVKVTGSITDDESGEPIYQASVYISETRTGAVSDLKGFFALILSPGKYNIQIRHMGYETEEYLFDVLSAGSVTIRMKKSSFQMQEVVVSGERQTDIRRKDPGLDLISARSIKSLPMMMGERDILKVSGTLPGIVSVGEGNAGLNVRGSASDQNAFYLNRIPIYNTFHLFGFIPLFNSDVIKDLTIYKGYIPSQYGGRLASVFNLTTRQGNRQHYTAHGSLSPFIADIVLEGPLKKDTASFIISARTSYSDWLLSRIRDTTINKSSTRFNDFSIGVNHDFKNTQTSLFVYHSYDHFRLSSIDTYEYSNTGASFTAGHNFSKSLRGEFSLIGSEYIFSTVNKLQTLTAYQHSYKLDHYELRTAFRHHLSDKHSLEYGADIVIYKLDRGTIQPYGKESLVSSLTLGKEKGIESSLYISDSYDVTSWMNINLGFRYTLFNPLGPRAIFRYGNNEPRDVRYITDTLYFRNNEAVKWYNEPDLRLAVNISTDKDGSVKLAFNQMHQNLFMLNNYISIAPNTQWKLADYHLPPSKSNQVSLGVFRTLKDSGLEASLEVYYKSTLNYPEFKDGADFLKNPLTETSVLQGRQKSYGIEFNLKRSGHKVDGWVSYTYSRSLIQVDGKNTWDKINNGEIYPANYDIPHSVNAVINYNFSKRVILSSVVTYQTGKPITYPESIYYIDNMQYLDYSKRNAYRIPYYLRTDISLTLEGNLKRDKIIHSSFVMSVYNVLGRMNPSSVYFVSENGRIYSYSYSVIGVPIFTATWLFKFGNYDSD